MHLLKKNFPLGFRIGVIAVIELWRCGSGSRRTGSKSRKQEAGGKSRKQEAGSKSRKQERRSKKQEAGLPRATSGMREGVFPSISIVPLPHEITSLKNHCSSSSPTARPLSLSPSSPFMLIALLVAVIDLNYLSRRVTQMTSR